MPSIGAHSGSMFGALRANTENLLDCYKHFRDYNVITRFYLRERYIQEVHFKLKYMQLKSVPVL